MKMCVLAVLGAIILVHGEAPAHAANRLEIVVGHGPHAGTYQLAAANTICLHAKERKQFSAAFKDTQALDPKALSSAGINVFNPDDSGAKWGQVNIRFGDPGDKRPAAFEVSIPRGSKESLTLTKKGGVVDLTFDGRTKDGIKLRVNATCTDIDEF